jgi:CheY-like chemotaxis protein
MTRDLNRAPLILVVDDDAAIRRFVRSILEQAGHTVLEADLPENALAVLRTHVPPPDLLLTDILMPGLNGIALAAQAHKIVPGLHVLFMSGFARHYAAELSGSVCLSKPFKPAELVASVQAALAPKV